MSNLEKIELLNQRTFLEFFAGIGLMRMGLELAGWSISFANDIARSMMRCSCWFMCDAASLF